MDLAPDLEKSLLSKEEDDVVINDSEDYELTRNRNDFVATVCFTSVIIIDATEVWRDEGMLLLPFFGLVAVLFCCAVHTQAKYDAYRTLECMAYMIMVGLPISILDHFSPLHFGLLKIFFLVSGLVVVVFG